MFVTAIQSHSICQIQLRLKKKKTLELELIRLPITASHLCLLLQSSPVYPVFPPSLTLCLWSLFPHLHFLFSSSSPPQWESREDVCLVDLVSNFHYSVSPLISLFHACSYIPLLNSKITRNLISPTQKLFPILGPIKYGQRIQEHAMTY